MSEYINRSDAVEAARHAWAKGIEPTQYIDIIPAADVRPVVRGRWVYDKDASDWGIGGYVCSECKNKNNNLPCNRVKSVQLFSGAKFCPNCGADMRGGGGENEAD